MAVTFGFYNSLNGDRKYFSTQFSQLFNALIKDGVFMHIGGHFNVRAGSGMDVIVESGLAWFDSTWTLNDADYPLDISVSDLLQTRIDAVILEVNTAVSSRTNTIKVLTGTPSSNPQKPSLTNTADIHQYPLAYVTVGVGATSITQANIENRIGTDPCPFVTGVLDTIDASTLIAQWEAQFNEWFESLGETLSGDVAGNLLNMINDLDEKVDQTVTDLNSDMEALHQKGVFLYSASFPHGRWSGNSQTATLTAIDGGPAVTSASSFYSAPMCKTTSNMSTNESLQESLNIINLGNRTLGNNTVTCNCAETPATDIVVIFQIRKGG